MQVNNANAKNVMAIISLKRAIGNAMIITSIYNVMETEFSRMTDPTKGNASSIIDVMYSPIKSDAVKLYSSILTKLVLNSQDNELCGLSKKTLTEDGLMFTTIVNKAATTHIGSHDQLFELLMVHLYGYDSSLVKMGMEEDYCKKSQYLFEYIANKFNLAIGYQDDSEYLDDFKVIDGKWLFENIDIIVTNLMEHFAGVEDILNPVLSMYQNYKSQ